MRTSPKIALSIIISLFITGGFGALANSGLSTFLETEFFRERVIADQTTRLYTIAETVVDWKSELQERFTALAGDRNFQAVFSSTPQEKEITYRAAVSDSLEDNLNGYTGMRIVDGEGRIQHSTFAGDIAAEQAPVNGRDGRRLYRNWEQVTGTFPLDIPASTSAAYSLFDGNSGQVVFLIPAKDTGFVTRGWMIVYVNPSGLGEKLAGEGMIGAAGRVQVIDKRGFIVDIRPEQIEAVGKGIDLLWPMGGSPAKFAALAESEGEKFFLAGTVADDGSWVGKIVPGRLLGFSPTIQVLILATFFISVFLMTFFFMNIRQDKTEIVRTRIKKLQVNLMRDWLANPENLRMTETDLELRRDEVKKELRSGMGRLRRHQIEKADTIIDEGWNRIIEILAKSKNDSGSAGVGTEAAVAPTPPPFDMKKLEEMITRAVSEAKSVPPEAFSGIHIQAAVPNVRPAPGRPAKFELVDDEDLEELDDVADLEDGDLEEPDDVADLEDGDLEEPGDVAELEDGDVEDPGDVADLDAADELEDLDASSEPLDEELAETDGREIDEEYAAQPVPDDAGKLFDTSAREAERNDVRADEEDEYEDLSQFDDVEELIDVEELPDVVPQDNITDMEQGDYKESTRTEFDNAGIEELEVVESMEYIEEEDQEVLEVLPVVLSDDARDPIEIDKVKRDRVYMFEKKSRKPESIPGRPDDISEVGGTEDRDEVLEELDVLYEETGDSQVQSVSSVQFFNIELIQERLKANDAEKISLSAGQNGESESMESLVKMRTTGLLPGADTLDDDFRFDDDTAELVWSADGLNYDRYMRGFKKGTTGIYKSFMSLSKDYGAICVVLMAGSRKGLETDYSFGLNDECATHLSVTRNEPVWAEWFSERRVVYVPILSESLYAEKTRHNEFRYISSAIFVPAVYHGSQSYLFFGFKDAPADPISVLAGLKTVK